MKNLLLLPLLTLAFTAVQAQTPAPAEKSDPEAKKLLDRVRKKYEAYKSVEVAFSLVIELPGQAQETQKGTVGQEGDKFRLDMAPQIITSDGKTTWVYLKKNNEIQISDTDPNDESGFITPKDLLNRYQKGDFLYAITDRVTEKGVVLTHIEFKPKSKTSEYSKLRVSINAKTNTIESR